MINNPKKLFLTVVLFPFLLSAQWVDTTIWIEGSPIEFVYKTSTNKIYCAAQTNPGDKVVVIDGASDSVIANITVGDSPCALVYNPINDKVYSANYFGDNVTVINGTTNSVITTIPVGDAPYDLAYNSTDNKIYCANRYGHNVTVIDGTTNSIITNIVIVFGGCNVYWNPIGLGYNPINNTIFCAGWYVNEVAIIDGTTDAVITKLDVGDHPYAFIHNPQQNKIYVANYYSNNVTVICDSLDTTTIQVISPNGGEQWQSGSDHTIVWGYLDAMMRYVRILFSSDGGNNYPDTLAIVSCNGESGVSAWHWVVPFINSTTCRIRIQALDTLYGFVDQDESDGNFTIGEPGIEEHSRLDNHSMLEINPNPFTQALSIRFSTLANEQVELKIYDVAGHCVKSFTPSLKSGVKGLIWDGKDNLGNRVPAGIYFVRLETSDFSAVKKAILLK